MLDRNPKSKKAASCVDHVAERAREPCTHNHGRASMIRTSPLFENCGVQQCGMLQKSM